jgi:enoyl-CoA hydratase/carnithine racemase
MNNDLVLWAQDPRGVVTLTLNRPQAFNALSEAMLMALQTALDRVAGNEQVRAVVISAAGKAFCAGHDLKEMRAAPSLAYYERLFAQCGRMMMSIQKIPVPVIAQVHGKYGRHVCRQWCQFGFVLQHAQRGAQPQPVTQSGV